MAASTVASVAVGLIILALWVSLPVVNALKGKWWFALFALAGGWLGIVGAIRLAKPHSYWARNWYSEEKMTRTMQRFGITETPPAVQYRRDRKPLRFGGKGGLFPGSLPPDVTPNPQDSEPWPDQDMAEQDKLTRRGIRR
jgi:hypothetical protein